MFGALGWLGAGACVGCGRWGQWLCGRCAGALRYAAPQRTRFYSTSTLTAPKRMEILAPFGTKNSAPWRTRFYTTPTLTALQRTEILAPPPLGLEIFAPKRQNFYATSKLAVPQNTKRFMLRKLTVPYDMLGFQDSFSTHGIELLSIFEYNKIASKLMSFYKQKYYRGLSSAVFRPLFVRAVNYDPLNAVKRIKTKIKNADIIVYPASIKQRKRGFDHVDLLLQNLCKALRVECPQKIPLELKNKEKIFYQKQSTLKRNTRVLTKALAKWDININVQNMTRIIIFDDVITTQSTVLSIYWDIVKHCLEQRVQCKMDILSVFYTPKKFAY